MGFIAKIAGFAGLAAFTDLFRVVLQFFQVLCGRYGSFTVFLRFVWVLCFVPSL